MFWRILIPLLCSSGEVQFCKAFVGLTVEQHAVCSRLPCRWKLSGSLELGERIVPQVSCLGQGLCARAGSDSAGLCLSCWHRNTRQSRLAPGSRCEGLNELCRETAVRNDLALFHFQ